MRILGLDTATRATTVALLDLEAGTVTERRDDPPRGERPRHTTRLLALAVEVLTDAGCGWEDLTRIAVGVGPGTFTGLRIGISTARALAAARDLPLVGVSTLRSLAHGAAATAAGEGRAVLAVLDARRGEVFAAGWSPGTVADPEALPLLAPTALTPEALEDALPGRGRMARRRGGGGRIPAGSRALGSLDSTGRFRAAPRQCHRSLPTGDRPARPEQRRCPAGVPAAPGCRAHAPGTRTSAHP